MTFDVSDLAYDRFMGRYSFRLAPLFADFAGVEAGQRVLDVGAGTGALTTELVRRADEVAAVEPSQGFAESLRARMPEVDARHGPGEELPWADDSFDAALAQLVVSFMQDAPKAAREMARVVRPGGVVAACMWGLQDVEMFNAINRAREAAAPETAEPPLARYRTEPELRELLEGAGLRDVETAPLDVEARYDAFDDFWDALRGGTGPAGDWILSLSDEQRALVREELFRQLGEPDGGFTLRGRAWAARGTA